MSARRPDPNARRPGPAAGVEQKPGAMGNNTKVLMMVLSGLAVVVMLVFRDSGRPACPTSTCQTLGAMRNNVLNSKSRQAKVFWEQGAVTQEERVAALTRGATIWMTGLSGSGKSTIGLALERRLVVEGGQHTYRLDGDNLRFGLSRDLTLAPEDRNEAVRRASEVALLMADSGTLTMVTLISPYKADRDAARKMHKDRDIPFIEVHVEVPVDIASERDPKGLYKLAKEGTIKGMTGIDAPYEKPVNPEVTLHTGTCCENQAAASALSSCKGETKSKDEFKSHCKEKLEACVTACVEQLHGELAARDLIRRKKECVAAQAAQATSPSMEAQPGEVSGHADGFGSSATPPSSLEENEDFWTSDEVTMLQPVPLRDVDVQWVQVIGEGWASPLKGPMRESALVQTLHFESMLVDTKDGGNSLYGPGPAGTDFGDSQSAARMVQNGKRVSMPIPITIPVCKHTKMLINRAIAKAEGKKVQLVLVSPAGEPVAVLDDPEVYPFRKEEMITRSWGSWDLDHPYIKENIMDASDFLLGGELSKVRRIKYRDGLDRWRLTPQELIEEFRKKGADGVYAFQTRNPTHAGHAHLMKDGRKQLMERGFKNPVLWLSPLGGWTKDDDVPLDIRVKQHQAVLDEKMLDDRYTVLAIWPSPMVYSGPTEVQWHAKSRRVAGADYFIVGRDPAGLSYSKQYAKAHGQEKADDVYDADHGRYVLQMSPGMGKLGLLASGAVHYDKTDGEMKPKPKGISKEDFAKRFLAISGSKMRQMGKAMVDVCDSIEAIPSTWASNPTCVPPKFMVPSGWKIMRDYYKNKDDPVVKANAVLQSKQLPQIAELAEMVNATKVGLPGELFAVYLKSAEGKRVSPWHDIPLKTGDKYNMVVEFPRGTNSKFEVQKDLPFNPIKQDVKKGNPRFYTYGLSFFNNGLFPQTWEDSALKDEAGNFGDNDPLDVMEVGSQSFPIGSVVPVKVLGSLALVDEGETDWKVIAIALSDPQADKINDIASLKEVKGEALATRIVEWLRRYKTTDKDKPDEAKLNTFLKDAEYQSVEETVKVIEHTNSRWKMLREGTVDQTDKTKKFWLKP